MAEGVRKVSDIAAFLAARLDEDEAAARDRLCVNCGDPTRAFGITGYTHGGDWQGRRCPGRVTGAQPVQNPARVLREVEAKRKIIGEHQAVTKLAGLTEQDLGFLGWYREWVLKNLAAIWSGHPDYDPAWSTP